MNSYRVSFVLLVCIALFLPFLGTVHLFDWDEINFAECAREMLASNNYSTVTIDYLPFWEKPPLFIWMQVYSMKLFGISAFAGRFPNFIAAIATAYFLYLAGKKVKNETFGYWWVAFYLGSFLPNLYFHSGIIDPWFNLFIIAAIYHLYKGHKNEYGIGSYLLAGVFMGLAIMTKGPVALVLVGGTALIYFISIRFRQFPSVQQLITFFVFTLLIGGIWFMLLINTGNKTMISEFISYQLRLFQTQDAGHGGPFYYHFIILLLGCFPASFFAIGYFIFQNKHKNKKESFDLWMKVVFWLTLLLFSIVSTKIIHYSSLCYFPLTYFAARWVQELKSTKQIKIVSIFTISYLVIFSIILLFIPYALQHKEWLIETFNIKDPFAIANLNAKLSWTNWDYFPGLFFLVGALLSLILLLRKQLKLAIIASLLTVALGILTIQANTLSKIEGISQAAAIEFFQKHKNENCYLIPLGYKSYAHLFYGETKYHKNNKRFDEAWLCNETTDKPVYFVSKIDRKEGYLKTYPKLSVLYEKNGFVFYTKMDK